MQNEVIKLTDKQPFYFETSDSEICYPASYFDKGTEVFESIPCKVSGIFFCKAVHEITEGGECGKKCVEYTPINGKSGKCKFRDNVLFEHGEKVTI